MTGVVFDLLEVTSFMAIDTAEVRLSNRGLVFIEGKNLDDTSANSNGAGKSSLVDAISWCLYGITARGVTGDAVINRQEGKGTEVALNFYVDGQLWRIERGRKHKTLKNRVKLYQMGSSTWDDMTLGTDKLTQERIDALLGCNAKTFCEAVYMGQENMPDLPSMTDKALKATLEQALSLDRLDEALAIANIRLENATTLHASVLRQADMLDDEVDGHTSVIADLRLQVTELEKEELALREEIHAETEAWEKKKVEVRDDYLRAKIWHDKLVTNLHQAREDLSNIDTSTEMTDLQSQGLDAQAKIKKAIRLRHDIEDRQREIDREALSLSGKKCRTCGHETETCLDTPEKAHDREQEKKVLATKLLALNKKEEGYEGIVADCQAKMMDLRVEAKRALVVAEGEEFSQVGKLRDLATKLRDLEKGVPSVVSKMANWHDDKIIQLASAKTMITKKEDQIRDLTTKRVGLTADISAAADRAAVMEKVKHVLSRKGFRGEVLDQVTPYLNARTQYYLTWLTSDNISAVWNTVYQTASGDLSESFHINVSHKEGAEAFEGLSGGEKRKVRLACAMALQDLVGTRAVKPIKLFIADEIDDAIDESGLELLMGLLEEKAKTVGSLLIISHNSLSDWCKESITMVKKNGATTVK